MQRAEIVPTRYRRYEERRMWKEQYPCDEDGEMDYITQAVKVFARAKPEDKLEIVSSFQRQGLVCAMTGFSMLYECEQHLEI